MKTLNIKIVQKPMLSLAFIGLFLLTNCNKTVVPSTDATLKSLAVATASGGANLITNFTATTVSYSVTLPTGTTKVFVTATANDTGATLVYLPAAGTDGGITLPTSNQVTVTVTTPDKKTTKTYTLNFTIPVATDNDATLKSLTVATASGGTNFITNFTATTVSYSVTLPTGTTKVFVTATANATGATLAYSPVAGTDGGITILTNNKVTVTVTAPDKKTTKTYTLNFTISSTPLSTDATLKSIAVTTRTKGTVSPIVFAPETLEYDVTLPFGTKKVSVVAVPNYAKATVTYTPAPEADSITLKTDNTVTLRVQAEDANSPVKQYVLKFNFANNPIQTSLTSLSVNLVQDDGKNLITGFLSATETYAVTVPSATPKIFVTAVAPSGATVTYSPNKETDGSIIIPGSKVVTVEVTEPSKTKKTYTITIAPARTGNDIVSFDFTMAKNSSLKQDYTGTVDNNAKTVTFVPFPLGVATALKPTIVVSAGATIKPKDGVETNFTTTQTYTVTAEDNSTKVYTVTVETDLTAVFISKWRVGATDLQVTLPLVSNGEYDFIVDWGDGTINTITEWSATEKTHSYTVAGTYTVKIGGTIVGWRFGDDATNAVKIVEVSKWGNLFLGNTAGKQFKGTAALVITATDAPGLSDNKGTFTTDLSEAFSNAHRLVDGISQWKTGKVTTMERMFAIASSFNEDLQDWDVSSVMNMSRMFHTAKAFNQPLSRWDVSKVKDMSFMFYKASLFNNDISNWKTEEVTNMSSMFGFATYFNQALNWNVAKVEDMSYMFQEAKAFNMPIGNWNTSKVTTMRWMFKGATEFNQDLKNWNVSNVTACALIFEQSNMSSGNKPTLTCPQ